MATNCNRHWALCLLAASETTRSLNAPYPDCSILFQRSRTSCVCLGTSWNFLVIGVHYHFCLTSPATAMLQPLHSHASEAPFTQNTMNHAACGPFLYRETALTSLPLQLLRLLLELGGILLFCVDSLGRVPELYSTVLSPEETGCGYSPWGCKESDTTKQLSLSLRGQPIIPLCLPRSPASLLQNGTP